MHKQWIYSRELQTLAAFDLIKHVRRPTLLSAIAGILENIWERRWKVINWVQKYYKKANLKKTPQIGTMEHLKLQKVQPKVACTENCQKLGCPIGLNIWFLRSHSLKQSLATFKIWLPNENRNSKKIRRHIWHLNGAQSQFLQSSHSAVQYNYIIGTMAWHTVPNVCTINATCITNQNSGGRKQKNSPKF